ncbi:MAG TPA: DUF4399 domain-containing protein [Gemmatimonadales bacterium]|nr:DUF4399 domain-containing protein [Gemmatimonadales bacterium]
MGLSPAPTLELATGASHAARGRYILCLAAAVIGSTCADRPAPPVASAAVQILAPANGDTVPPDVVVRLGVTGERVVPATGIRVEGEGHHHLFVDADLTPADSIIPKTGGIYHIGSGADSLLLQGLAPGTHRIIARFAYGDHVPMPNVATDTIWVVVR